MAATWIVAVAGAFWLLVMLTHASMLESTGRLQQLEYALKAANQGGDIVALRASDGVVVLTAPKSNARSLLGTLLPQRSSLKKLHKENYFVAAGLAADVRYLEEESFAFCMNYIQTYGCPPPVTRVARFLANSVHERTLSPNLRPLGAACCLIGRQGNGPLLIEEIDPTGQCHRCYATAIGMRAKSVLQAWPASPPVHDLSSAEVAEKLGTVWETTTAEDSPAKDVPEYTVQILPDHA